MMDKAARSIAEQLTQLWRYVAGCWDAPISSGACGTFWYWVAVSSLLLGILLIVGIAINYARWRHKWDEAMRAQAQREAINHDAINELRWRGDDPSFVTQNDGHIAYSAANERVPQ